jgi:hypothetical protein
MVMVGDNGGRGYYGIAWKAWVIVERVSAFEPGGFPMFF